MGHWWMSAVWANTSIPKLIFLCIFQDKCGIRCSLMFQRCYHAWVSKVNLLNTCLKRWFSSEFLICKIFPSNVILDKLGYGLDNPVQTVFQSFWWSVFLNEEWLAYLQSCLGQLCNDIPKCRHNAWFFPHCLVIHHLRPMLEMSLEESKLKLKKADSFWDVLHTANTVYWPNGAQSTEQSVNDINVVTP